MPFIDAISCPNSSLLFCAFPFITLVLLSTPKTVAAIPSNEVPKTFNTLFIFISSVDCSEEPCATASIAPEISFVEECIFSDNVESDVDWLDIKLESASIFLNIWAISVIVLFKALFILPNSLVRLVSISTVKSPSDKTFNLLVNSLIEFLIAKVSINDITVNKLIDIINTTP